jgi:hypothetical protein
MSNLPSKFDSKLWEGWGKCPCPAPNCETILRESKGGTIAVIPEGGKFSGVAARSMEFTSMRSESDVLTWANWVANKAGGWK